MPTAEFNVEDFSERGNPADETLLVKFFMKTRPDSAATEREGHPMFKEVEYIDIRSPGERTNFVCAPASDRYRQRFPKHYDAFKRRVALPVDGMPLAEWTGIARSQVETLAYHNVKTVEQLAGMSDTNAGKFMGIHKLQKNARAYLEQAKEGVTSKDLRNQLAERDGIIEQMKARLDDLEAKSEPESAAAGVDTKDGDSEALTSEPTRRTTRRRPKKAPAKE